MNEKLYRITHPKSATQRAAEKQFPPPVVSPQQEQAEQAWSTPAPSPAATASVSRGETRALAVSWMSDPYIVMLRAVFDKFRPIQQCCACAAADLDV